MLQIAGGGGLMIKSVQRDIAFTFNFSGNTSQTVDNTISVDPAMSFAIPKTYDTQGSPACSGGIWWYGGSVWVQSATVLRGTLASNNGTGGNHVHYADLYTMANKPKSIQIVSGGTSPVTITAVDVNRVWIIPLYWSTPIDNGMIKLQLTSPTQVTVPTGPYSANCRWLLIDP
ncbi:MAG: hypothetical protein V1806_07310 [Pseudomonadota bacterium]